MNKHLKNILIMSVILYVFMFLNLGVIAGLLTHNVSETSLTAQISQVFGYLTLMNIYFNITHFFPNNTHISFFYISLFVHSFIYSSVVYYLYLLVKSIIKNKKTE
jgi:hypothetical protein